MLLLGLANAVRSEEIVLGLERSRLFSASHILHFSTQLLNYLSICSTLWDNCNNVWYYSCPLFLFHFLHTIHFISRELTKALEIERFNLFTLAHST